MLPVNISDKMYHLKLLDTNDELAEISSPLQRCLQCEHVNYSKTNHKKSYRKLRRQTMKNKHLKFVMGDLKQKPSVLHMLILLRFLYDVFH